MELSGKGMEFLKSIETFRSKPYDDQTGDEITGWCKGATIGYGHLISSPEWDLFGDHYLQGIDKQEADRLFRNDLRPFVEVVNNVVQVALQQNQFDALVILTFNIGATNFSRSSVLKMVNDPDVKTSYRSLESAWKAWKKSQGRVMQGLINRRNAEWRIYSEGVYERW